VGPGFEFGAEWSLGMGMGMGLDALWRAWSGVWRCEGRNSAGHGFMNQKSYIPG
jgi:hypothetical protein